MRYGAGLSTWDGLSRYVALSVATVLIVASCSDSDDAELSAATSSTSVTTTTEPARFSADAIYDIEGCFRDQAALLSTVIAVRPELGTDGGYVSQQLLALQDRCDRARAYIEAEAEPGRAANKATDYIEGRGAMLLIWVAGIQLGEPLESLEPDPATGLPPSESTPAEWVADGEDLLADLEASG